MTFASPTSRQAVVGISALSLRRARYAIMSSILGRPQILTTTNSDAASTKRAASLLGAAFANDALNRYFILTLDSLPNTAIFTPERLSRHFLSGIEKKVAMGALLVEAGDWAAAALWLPPGLDKPKPDLLPEAILEYVEKFDQVKKAHLGSRECWYLNLIGRHPQRLERGVVSALILPFLQEAKKAGMPAYLEATTEHARDVYVNYGFRVVEVVRVGKGKASRSGDIQTGGEGIDLYAMVAEPDNMP